MKSKLEEDVDVAHESWWQTFEVVFGVPFLAAIALQFVVPLSLPQGYSHLPSSLAASLSENGSIILTSGIAGEKIYQGASTMALINSATETLGRSLAVELAPVRVNVVSPGFVKPKPRALQEMANQFPAQRLASPGEIALAYLRLMENEYVTGTVTVVDGGATLM